MDVIILAGGLGTRLRSVVSDIPKVMAQVNEVPFLSYILNNLEKNGIIRVILAVGYKREMIKTFFGSRFKGIELLYSEEEEPIGTGGAIRNAFDYVRGEDSIIINGDTFLDVDLQKIVSEFRCTNAQLLLSLKTMHNFDRYGCVETDFNQRVISFREKTLCDKGNINTGCYVAKKSIFQEFDLPNKFSFEEFIQSNVNKLDIFSYVSDGYFIDIGIPEDYEKAKSELRRYL
ncbi:nucleotidyltransferase family protein [Dehalobacter sp. CF]|jgi:Nucleoside-diphosphate-sugar pyrophosphorylase involved in lipopolysaccharide biosynthesis/translation initiation factor 2B, gamma/epsilon subunits (eIF-2Bgamma/eIF-2Bepsilon)|uniref:nucleotidyltransferase family protein n=1 Tax=Dehalobacter sp. CF TaxID=1131462 RepID=UPI00028B139C|nr:nucleotidyltransferase family protein [Dehalobacter sp. CF]AFV05141.1 D-glycero-D-manno-heptose 1-phosphate guanosyltransferase [Dehalobacter sp. CF]